MQSLLGEVLKIWFKLPQQFRFLLVGGYNTVISYGIFCLMNFLFGVQLHYLLILAFCHFISVTHSFLNLRFFVFRSNGHFWQEFLKVNLVYLGYFCCNATLLCTLKELVGINIFVAQLICILTLFVATYFLHKNFSFKKKI